MPSSVSFRSSHLLITYYEHDERRPLKNKQTTITANDEVCEKKIRLTYRLPATDEHDDPTP